MRIEFIPKTRGKVDAITPLAEKRGQTETRPAVSLTITTRLTADRLAMFDKTLPRVLFRTPRKEEIEQGQLEGVGAASALTKLTEFAKATGTQSWAGEQSGSKLNIYWGIGSIPLVQLVDVKLDKFKIAAEDEGIVEVTFNAYSATDIDEEVMGHLGVLKAQELDFEVVPPEPVKPTKDLVEQARDTKQTPEQALSAVLGQDVGATTH